MIIDYTIVFEQAWRIGSSHRQQLGSQAAAVPGLLTRGHPRTSIDEHSGRAEDQRLFSVEEARAGLKLAGCLEIDPELSRHHVALLVAALRFVREIGGGRRRGCGACRLRIEAADLEPAFASWQDAVRHLAQSADPQDEPPIVTPVPPPFSRQVRLRETGPTVLELTAMVVGEVALGRRPEAGNLIRGRDYVPGSTVRGALAARWPWSRDGEEFQRCFVSGDVRFGFLYPLFVEDATATPMPISLHTCKLRPGAIDDDGHGIVDLLLTPQVESCSCSSRLVPGSSRSSGNLRRSSDGCNEDSGTSAAEHARAEYPGRAAPRLA